MSSGTLSHAADAAPAAAAQSPAAATGRDEDDSGNRSSVDAEVFCRGLKVMAGLLRFKSWVLARIRRPT